MKTRDVVVSVLAGVGFLTLVGGAAGVMGYRTWVAEPFRIPSDGMYPSLPAGTTVWVDKRICRAVGDVRRGDVVVFRHAGRDGKTYNYIWRVVGLPGERVTVDGHRVWIDGAPLARSASRRDGAREVATESAGDASWEVAWTSGGTTSVFSDERVVPPDHLYVLGDNRLDATDSRMMGPIPIDAVIGCVSRG